jgi:hypothetical protein
MDIPKLEKKDLTPDQAQALNDDPSTLPEGTQAPVVLVGRHAPAYLDGELMYGVNATYISGFDANGVRIAERGLQERRTAVGKLWQAAVERWKILRVKREINRSIGSIALETNISDEA